MQALAKLAQVVLLPYNYILVRTRGRPWLVLPSLLQYRGRSLLNAALFRAQSISLIAIGADPAISGREGPSVVAGGPFHSSLRWKNHARFLGIGIGVGVGVGVGIFVTSTGFWGVFFHEGSWSGIQFFGLWPPFGSSQLNSFRGDRCRPPGERAAVPLGGAGCKTSIVDGFCVTRPLDMTQHLSKKRRRKTHRKNSCPFVRSFPCKPACGPCSPSSLCLLYWALFVYQLASRHPGQDVAGGRQCRGDHRRGAQRGGRVQGRGFYGAGPAGHGGHGFGPVRPLPGHRVQVRREHVLALVLVLFLPLPLSVARLWLCVFFCAGCIFGLPAILCM